MGISKTTWTRVGIGLVGLVLVLGVGFEVARRWVVPGVIAGRIGAVTGSRVEIDDYWVDGTSAGVVGLKIHEGKDAGSPVWFKAGRVKTDLTRGRLLHGNFQIGRVDVSGSEVALRVSKEGVLLTKFGTPAASTKSEGPLPKVIVEGATVRVAQEGRPEMVVKGVTARLGAGPGGKGAMLAARANDPNWGVFEAHGDFEEGFHAGRVEVKSMAPVAMTPEKGGAIPFVPDVVWSNVSPTGNLDLNLAVALAQGKSVLTIVIGLRGTKVKSNSLGLTATEATGNIVVDGSVVRFEKVSGKALGGKVSATGTMGFGPGGVDFDLGLDLTGVDMTQAPKSWQLDESGLTGKLTGEAQLRAKINAAGALDLSGTTGDAVVEGGTIQGIAFKSMRLTMKGDGEDLQYDSKDSSKPSAGMWRSLLGAALIAVQATATAPAQPPTPPTLVRPSVKAKAKEDAPAAAPAPKKKGGLTLPKTISTHLELEDVELAELITRAETLLGFPFPLPITGKLALKADATIPLGRLHQIKDYAFHGDLTLTRASIYRVDVGRLTTRVDLEDGHLELKDLRGRLVDHPSGNWNNPPRSKGGEQDVPTTGPLPSEAFRGSLSAQISPPGRLTATFEGHRLPMGELGAPLLPRPTPLSGNASMSVTAAVDLDRARDPRAWTLSVTARSRQIRYLDAALDAVGVTGWMKDGRVEIKELDALLRERPLAARGHMDLTKGYAFEGSLDVTGWEVSDVLPWVPGAPKTAPITGALTARAKAGGTLEPRAITTEGNGRFDHFQGGPLSLGDLPFTWVTKGDVVALALHDARPFGGRMTAEGMVPLTPGRAIEGTATLTDVEAAGLTAALAGSGLAMSGKANASATFHIPPDLAELVAEVKLSAPDLKVQGVPAERVLADVKASKGRLDYDLTAESLGGRVKFRGGMPLEGEGIAAAATGELRGAGFTLGRYWRATGMTGALAKLEGEAAIDANLRALLTGDGTGLYAHGVAEVRDLKWGHVSGLGRAKGILALLPTSWRVDPLSGEVLGGALSGNAWGTPARSAPAPASTPANLPPAIERDPVETLKQVGFSLRVDQISLKHAAAFFPASAGLGVDGEGTLLLAGLLGETFRGTGELVVPRARVAGMPVTELRLPAELVSPGGNASGTVHLRHGSARVAGGHVRGDGSFRVGVDRSFNAEMRLADIEMEVISRVFSEARRPASGKVTGKLTLAGHDLSDLRGYRGRVVLDLDDASLVALPVFRELDRFLGASRGGLFEDGDLIGTIANRQIILEEMTLAGRLAQLHVTGTVGFDGALNLEVLVNTNQIIPQTGQALVGAIPGLSGLVGRNQEARLQFANFLSNRLLKFRVTGTFKNPSVGLDAGVAVADSAVGFFGGVLKMPLGLIK